MFITICEVCRSEPQFRTVEADFSGEKRTLNVCMDCAYAIEEMEKREVIRDELSKL